MHITDYVRADLEGRELARSLLDFILDQYYNINALNCCLNIKTHDIMSCGHVCSQYGRARDKCVLYRNQENVVFTHL